MTRSCGCFQREGAIQRATKHGHASRRRPSSAYRTWGHMLSRCRDSAVPEYRYYGGRGITVCERWLRFENFLADMGEPPRGKSIERIDVNGNYEPSNCRWATQREQCNNQRRNRRISAGGLTLTLVQWATATGIKRETIAHRLDKGMSPEMALDMT